MKRFAFTLLLVSILLGSCTPTSQALDTSFPTAIDPDTRYLFYLHGKIIEDQGLPAISEEYGEYQYDAILKRFVKNDFRVISELRATNTDVISYAENLTEQILALLKAGVPANNITVVGASKGAFIAIFTSHFLDESQVNYVFLGGCPADELSFLIQERMYLHGNILSIYDAADKFADSCKPFFLFSEGNGIANYNEIILDVGTGHGILYQPFDEWVLPAINWAKQQ